MASPYQTSVEYGEKYAAELAEQMISGRPVAPGEKLMREGRLFAFGSCANCALIHPSGRRIHYSAKPSRHACNALCMSARGPNCECRCGGKNHGAGFIPSLSLFEDDAA
jgi:hypothetical protein